MKHIHNGQTHIWYDEELVTTPADKLFHIEYWQSLEAVIGSAQGRGTTWFIKMERIEAALRHYRRGGLFGKLIKDHYWFSGLESTRSYAELTLLKKLNASGVNVPKPIAARVKKCGVTYQADLLSEKVANAKDLVDILQTRSLSDEEYTQIGREIAKMHQAQVNHTDLNIHNILLDDNGKVWIIDFDKCAYLPQQSSAWKTKNLDRLLRSFRKEQTKRNIQWNESQFEILLNGYRTITDN